ncbi:MAG: DUF3795 domain-containing protein [Bacteroidota bacterium]
MAFLRKRNSCVGCNMESPQKINHCFVCSIKNCTERPSGSQFCFACKKYPCIRLKQLDKRYRAKYSMSMIENLNKITESGLDRFMEIENTRWVCPQCGDPICVHNKRCYHCSVINQ